MLIRKPDCNILWRVHSLTFPLSLHSSVIITGFSAWSSVTSKCQKTQNASCSVYIMNCIPKDQRLKVLIGDYWAPGLAMVPVIKVILPSIGGNTYYNNSGWYLHSVHQNKVQLQQAVRETTKIKPYFSIVVLNGCCSNLAQGFLISSPPCTVFFPCTVPFMRIVSQSSHDNSNITQISHHWSIIFR